MVIESNEEVFRWFKDLSGAQRIEVLSTLIHSCIPLEWRFFASVIENLARRDYGFIREDELAANSPTEMETFCEKDWLADLSPTHNRLPPPDNQNGLVDRSHVPTDPSLHVNHVVEKGLGDVLTSPAQQTQQPAPGLANVRSKLIVMICLLRSTNRVCATILFNALQKQFSIENLKDRLEIRPNPGKDSQAVFPEINLSFTLSIYHPAFSVEQQGQIHYQVTNSLSSHISIIPVSRCRCEL